MAKRSMSLMNGGILVDLDALERKHKREMERLEHNLKNKQQRLV